MIQVKAFIWQKLETENKVWYRFYILLPLDTIFYILLPLASLIYSTNAIITDEYLYTLSYEQLISNYYNLNFSKFSSSSVSKSEFDQ